MSNLRFNHAFAALMFVGLLSAFVIPPHFTNPARAELQGLFSPISRPVRGISGIIYRHFNAEGPVDDGSPRVARAPETILDENRRLRTALFNLTVKFDQLSQLNADRQLVGDIRSLCQPASVTGSDSSGIRESISIGSPTLGGLKMGMPVLSAGGLVGRIARAGISSAQVRLITDPGFELTGRIQQYQTDADGKISPKPVGQMQPLVEGIGHGAMAIRNNISMEQATKLGIDVNDYIILDDHDWPDNLQGYPIGRIVSIRPQQNAPLFADISVKPMTGLMQLREVMVFTAKN